MSVQRFAYITVLFVILLPSCFASAAPAATPTLSVAAGTYQNPQTVKNYLFRAFEKLGVSSRIELLFYLTMRGHTFKGAKGDGDELNLALDAPSISEL